MADQSQEITISTDFYSDWTALLRERLDEAGYPIEQGEESDICLHYFNAAERRVPARPRRIHVSGEFSCPPDHKRGLTFLQDKIRNGDDLTPYLSRKIVKLSYNDPILNDWGIHHFHLGLTYNHRGLIQGTPYILLARVMDDDFYMIDVVEHELWHQSRYIEILHTNWPRSIERRKCGEGENLLDPPDDQGIKTLRKGNVNYMTGTADGTCYSPIGGGYATSGVGIEAVRHCSCARKLLRNMEKVVKEKGKEFLVTEAGDGRRTCSAFHFRLELRIDGVHAVDEQALSDFFLGDRQNRGILYGHPSLPLRLAGVG